MGRKRTGAMPTVQPREEKKTVINATEILIKSAGYSRPSCRTGKYMTEKDRPRKKTWKKEYCG